MNLELLNYVVALRKELLRLSRACGVSHPALISTDHFEILDDRLGSTPASEIFGYDFDRSMSGVEDPVATGH